MSLITRLQQHRNDVGQAIRAIERADWMAIAADQFLKAYSEAAEREGWQLTTHDPALVETFNELRSAIHEYQKRTP